MPIFEYRCRKCNHITDILEKSGNKESHVCEKCGSKSTKKIFSTFSAKVEDSDSGCSDGTCSL